MSSSASKNDGKGHGKEDFLGGFHLREHLVHWTGRLGFTRVLTKTMKVFAAHAPPIFDELKNPKHFPRPGHPEQYGDARVATERVDAQKARGSDAEQMQEVNAHLRQREEAKKALIRDEGMTEGQARMAMQETSGIDLELARSTLERGGRDGGSRSPRRRADRHTRAGTPTRTREREGGDDRTGGGDDRSRRQTSRQPSRRGRQQVAFAHVGEGDAEQAAQDAARAQGEYEAASESLRSSHSAKHKANQFHQRTIEDSNLQVRAIEKFIQPACVEADEAAAALRTFVAERPGAAAGGGASAPDQVAQLPLFIDSDVQTVEETQARERAAADDVDISWADGDAPEPLARLTHVHTKQVREND